MNNLSINNLTSCMKTNYNSFTQLTSEHLEQSLTFKHVFGALKIALKVNTTKDSSLKLNVMGFNVYITYDNSKFKECLISSDSRLESIKYIRFKLIGGNLYFLVRV